jgi:hypothetical protein
MQFSNLTAESRYPMASRIIKNTTEIELIKG